MPWKVVIVGPTHVALTGAAFDLLYSFPTREAAGEHAKCFLNTGMKVALCDEEGTITLDFLHNAR